MSLAIAAAKPQGDPGLFGFLGKAVGAVTGLASSFIPGPAGAIARGLQSKIFGGGVQRVPTPSYMTPALPTSTRALPRLDMPQPRRIGQQPSTDVVPYQAPGMEDVTMYKDVTPAIACPSGYRPNKSAYYRRLKSPGNPEGMLIYVTKGSRCVKIRHRNPANPRAADRALGRIKSAKRFATKMNQVTIRDPCCAPRRRKK